MKTRQEIINEGSNAALSGKSLDSNPYRLRFISAKCWTFGWYQGRISLAKKNLEVLEKQVRGRLDPLTDLIAELSTPTPVKPVQLKLDPLGKFKSGPVTPRPWDKPSPAHPKSKYLHNPPQREPSASYEPPLPSEVLEQVLNIQIRQAAAESLTEDITRMCGVETQSGPLNTDAYIPPACDLISYSVTSAPSSYDSEVCSSSSSSDSGSW